MKYTLFFICNLLMISVFWQQNVNIQKGYIAEGYDVVAYFNNKAIEGKKAFQYDYKGAKYKFASKENLIKFKKNPSKYSPEYGGWCAYAMAKTGDKVNINPKTFEIRDGKLYLFYNRYFNNTLKSWKAEGADKLQQKANVNWRNLKVSK